MKTKTKEILQELTDFEKAIQPTNYLLKAYKSMEFFDLSNLITKLLSWRKVNIHFPDLPNDYYEEKFVISDVLYNRFKRFFEYCPELSEIFTLKPTHIEYNSALTDDEKQEISKFIDENYTITMRKTRRI